jgi:TPR repeat protein
MITLREQPEVGFSQGDMDMLQNVRQLQVLCWLNRSLCHFLLEEYEESFICCAQVFKDQFSDQKSKIKALLRAGQNLCTLATQDDQKMKNLLQTAVLCTAIAKKTINADPVNYFEFMEAMKPLQRQISDLQSKIETKMKCLLKCSKRAAPQQSPHPFIAALQTHPAFSMVGRAFSEEVAAHAVYHLAARRSFARCETIFCCRAPSQAHAQWQYALDVGSKQRRSLLALSALHTVLVMRMMRFQGVCDAITPPLSLVKRVVSRRMFLVSKEQAKCFFMEGNRLYHEHRFSDAATLWGRAALLQHGPSHAFLSNMLIEGRQGVQKDVKKAFELASSGATLGCYHSKGTLSICYLAGLGVAQDSPKALSFARTSAREGSCFGLHALAGCARAGITGCGVARNDAFAAEALRLAAASGHSDALVNLGDMFSTGAGVAKDEAKCFELNSRAAAQGHPLGYYNVANTLFHGAPCGIAQDYAEAAKFFQLAAAAGNIASLCRLAHMFLNGQGVAQDDVEAVRLFGLAAEQGDAEAQCELGNLHYRGQGVKQDDAEAVRLYRLSAAQNHATAQFNLGNMYSKGRGVARDKKEAVKLYTLASMQGNTLALRNLRAMASNGQGDDQTSLLYSLAARSQMLSQMASTFS